MIKAVIDFGTNIKFILMKGTSLFQYTTFDYSSDTLSSILLNRLMKQLNVSSPDSLLELGYFDTEDIMATENFYLTDTGICWVYNPYEIACYATGQTSIEIPFKEIDSYILPDSPVRRLIK